MGGQECVRSLPPVMPVPIRKGEFCNVDKKGKERPDPCSSFAVEYIRLFQPPLLSALTLAAALASDAR